MKSSGALAAKIIDIDRLQFICVFSVACGPWLVRPTCQWLWMGTIAVLPVSFRSRTASSSHPFAFLPPSANTSPHKRGVSPSSSRWMPPHRLFLGLTVTIQIEGKRAAVTMDSSSRTSSAPLMLLPEDLILHILILHIEDPHGMAASQWFARLRHVCAMFRQICDSPEVLRRLPLRDIRPRRPDVKWSHFEIHYTTTPQRRRTVSRYKSIYRRTVSRYKLIPTDSSRRCKSRR